MKSPGQNAQAFTASIANGQSLSAAVDLGDARALVLNMPAAWDAANLTFQVSDDGVTYRNLYDKSGNEYTVTASTSRAILLPISEWLVTRYLKIRSGTSSVAVNQTAIRSIGIQAVY